MCEALALSATQGHLGCMISEWLDILQSVITAHTQTHMM